MAQPIVLVVDDEDDLRTAVAVAFSRRGYEVRTAVDAAEALAMVETLVPDVIITDVVMPNMTGLELVQALRANERTAHVPILMLSAMDQVEDIVAGYDRGADEYVTKPFELTVLVAKAESLIRRAARQPPPPAAGGDGPLGRVAALAPVKGGVGNTTIAAAAAALICERGTRTCLLDLQDSPGHAAAMLGGQVAKSLAGTSPGEVESHLAALIAQTPAGVPVVTACPDAVTTPTAEGVGRALEQLRRTHQLVIVDLPGTPQPWARPALDLAEVVCLVAGPQMVAVEAVTGGSHWLAGVSGASDRTVLVINRLVRAGLDAEGIVRRLGRPPDVVIPYSDRLLQLGSAGWLGMARGTDNLFGELAGLLAAMLEPAAARVR
jgi:DNA-binding response OmpR family regulator